MSEIASLTEREMEVREFMAEIKGINRGYELEKGTLKPGKAFENAQKLLATTVAKRFRKANANRQAEIKSLYRQAVYASVCVQEDKKTDKDKKTDLPLTTRIDEDLFFSDAFWLLVDKVPLDEPKPTPRLNDVSKIAFGFSQSVEDVL